MTISLVGVSSAATGGANLTVALPGGTAADDVAVLFITQRLGGGVCGTPTGWTIMPGFPYPLALNDGVQAFYKRLVGGDANPTSVFSNISGQGVVGVLAVYRGVHLTLGPFAYNAAVSGGSTLSLTIPALTTEISNLRLLNFMGTLYQSSAPTMTTPNGFTNQVALGVGTSWPCHSTLADKAVTNGEAAQTSATWTVSFGGYNTMIALIDADQPNKYSTHQGSTASVFGRTDFPEFQMGTYVTGGNGLSVPIPAECLVGDVMVLFAGSDNGRSGPNTPAGWTNKLFSSGGSGQRWGVWTRVKQVGDTTVSITTALGDGSIWGRILYWHNSRQYDKQTAIGTASSQYKTPASLTTIDDVYSEVIAINVQYGNAVPIPILRAGFEQGFTVKWSAFFGGFGNTSWAIATRQHFGASTQVGPTFDANTGIGYTGNVAQFNIEAFWQPAPIAASIQQGGTGSVAIHADQGWPIEAHIQQPSSVQPRLRGSWPKHRKPVRKYVWVHDYNDERVMVVD